MSQSKNTVTETKNATIDGRTNEDIVADIQAGNNVMYNKEVLCRKNEGFVAHCIKAYVSSSIFSNQDEKDEYMQEGYLGLLQAAMDYKVGESRFTTYAAWHIRRNLYALLRFKMTSLYIPSAYWESIVKFRKATRQLDIEGKETTFENISQLIDITPQTYQSLLKANSDVAVISLNVKCISDDEGSEYWEYLEANDDTEAEVIQEIYYEQIQKALDSSRAISKRGSKMICERIFDGMKFEDIGKKNSCTKSNARMVINSGLDKLLTDSDFSSFFTDRDTAVKEAARRREELLINKRKKNESRKEYHRQYYLRKKQEKAAKMTE